MKVQDRFIGVRVPQKLHEQLSTTSRKWQISKQKIMVGLLDMVLSDVALREQLFKTLGTSNELAKEDRD